MTCAYNADIGVPDSIFHGAFVVGSVSNTLG